jgi:DNA-binding NarL/FixJ family response regulator
MQKFRVVRAASAQDEETAGQCLAADADQIVLKGMTPEGCHAIYGCQLQMR